MANPEENQVEETVVDEVQQPEEGQPADELDLFGMSDEEFLEAEANGSLNTLVSESTEEPEEGSEEAPENDPEETSDEDNTNAQEDDENASDEDTDASEDEDVEFSKEEAYDELMSEFKANGKMMKVNSVEEARKLMQMGANYHKKMNEMKGDRQIIQVLKDNGLLDQGKINYLIDLSKNDPKAIQQLLKEAKMDPLDIDLDGAEEYTPNTYEANEAQVQLDETLQSLQDSEGYSTTMEIITGKWDGESKVALAQNPKDIEVLNSHVEQGIYEKVSAEVDRQRMLGNLSGVSDFEAYKMVGNQMYQDELAARQKAQANVNQAQADKSNTAAKDKRKAAAPTKGTSQGKKPGVKRVNPLAMSDEEFEKAFGS